MPRKTLLICCLLGVVVFYGCFKSQTSNNNDSSAVNNKPAAASSPDTNNAEKIGIPECDDFVAKYRVCISDHVPDAQKRQFQENIDAWQNAWRQLAKSADKDTLAAACKRHSAQARESMKSFNCEF